MTKRRVLIAGGAWTVQLIHQKGFDTKRLWGQVANWAAGGI